jgi:hypothetical protein
MREPTEEPMSSDRGIGPSAVRRIGLFFLLECVRFLPSPPCCWFFSFSAAFCHRMRKTVAESTRSIATNSKRQTASGQRKESHALAKG